MRKIFRGIIKPVFLLVAGMAVFFLLSYLLTAGEYTVPKTVDQDPSIPHVTINGVVFHAETFGAPANPVVIVVHGGPGWDYRSLLLLQALADEFFVVFYDQRGTGLSPRVNPEELSLESSLSDLDLIIEHYGQGEKVNLIGHSWGAMLVAGYIGKHPEKVNRAVLAEPGFLTTEMAQEAGINFGPRWEIGFLLRATKAWFESWHVKGPDEEASMDYLVGQVGPYANPEYYCQGIVPDVATAHWRAGAQTSQAILRSKIDAKGKIDINLVEGLEAFKQKVLLMASECNRLIGEEHQAKQVKFFPNAELVVLQGSGHMMFAEKPEDSVAIVREYLDSPE